ncbi:ATP-binding cassette domain-containing protein [Paracoccus sp. Z330]|uniref:ATP-binding cassette domain-containing protein n=1 Tax=Paracoccus onchidii TaxID=3017813 RepID=A0ABT4ZGG9_9RHOB|nr:ATP-binding cassette domain-containing protein [Paracoccus onchidii]MDB6178058.1 ATP-binding cassette domain-containing protein [Paracoccus onchidii]
MIELKNLRQNYGSRTVVDVDALTLPEGGLTSIIGPNGAGKSSLLGMIAGLQRPTRGQVILDGQDILRMPRNRFARRLAVLRQDNSINARLTVRDLVGFGRYPHSRGRLNACDVRHIAHAIKLVALEEYQHSFLDEMSGGQRQRAFIAMVLAQNTEYALFDEPLNSLDIKHAVGIMQLLRRAVDQHGKTAIVVLHDLNFAARHSDRIIAMRDGKIIADGKPENVITTDVLSKIYDMKLNVLKQQNKQIVDVFGK